MIYSQKVSFPGGALYIGIALLWLATQACTTGPEPIKSISEIAQDSPNITGKEAYLDSPYVTAGDRAYLVGHQNGAFPELGWHIKGEMGGLWNHPIKLLDGFEAIITVDGKQTILNNASQFVNYPYANKHVFNLKELDLQITRWQFVPDATEGVLVQFEIENTGPKNREIEFTFKAYSDLSPTWLGERTQMTDGIDQATFDQESGSYTVYDLVSPWSVLIASNATPVNNATFESPFAGSGIGVSLSYNLNIPANNNYVHNMAIGGSYISTTASKSTVHGILDYWPSMVQGKKERYQELAQQSKLTIPDKKLEETFEWLKYNSDWLIRDVPEVGRGITAGIPDYPWWFGVDSEYALKGYMTIGQTNIVYSTIALLDSVSNAVNGNGRIIHEMSTNGAVFNPGNINETPQFWSLIWEVYKWNGDKTFLEKYYPTIEQGVEWLLFENDANKNMFPDGFGMMEIHGLDSEMIDVAVYTQRGLRDAAMIAEVLEKDVNATIWQKSAYTLQTRINDQFWSEEFNSYADFIGTDQQALHLIEDAIVRADTLNKPWAVAELKATRDAIIANPSSEPRPFVLHHNWVVNTPMEMGIAPREKALTALKTAEQFVNPFGVFVTGIDRDDSAGSDDGSFKGSKQFSYTGAVMTLPTSVLAIAENNYGNPDKALNYINRMTRSFSYAFPGSMYEVSPDYGMITQAWNIYGYGVPIVQQFFGIQPDAANKRVAIQLQMPEAWPEASLENVIMADNAVSVYYKKEANSITVRVTKTNPDWEVLFYDLPVENGVYKVIQGSEAQDDQNISKAYHTKANEYEVQITWE